MLVACHKYDGLGGTQIFLARREAAGWRVAQASDWRGFRWDFRGRGSLDFRLVDGVEPAPRRRPLALAWITLPPNRDLPSATIPADRALPRRARRRPVKPPLQ